jgi:hypothetical protein
MPSPQTGEIACYFYNRIEKDADVVLPDPSVLDLIREVEQNGKA